MNMHQSKRKTTRILNSRKLAMQGPPLPPDNRYQCDICKYEIEGYRAYEFHLKLAHKLHFVKKLIYKHWLRLDGQESPYICPDCGRHFKATRHYEMHMGTAHKNDMLSMMKEKMLPIINDPNNYCQSCENTYSNKNNFRAHLRKVHSIAIYNRVANVVPDPHDPDFNCAACQKKYENKKKYRKHLYSIHNIRSVNDKLVEIDSNVKLEEHDPNLIMKQATMSNIAAESLYSTSNHKGSNGILRRRPESLDLEKEVASTTVKKKKEGTSLLPKIGDPNFYCRVCKKTYSNKYSYSVHLDHVHDIQPPQHLSKTPVDPDKLFPDPHDPDFYCRICEITHFNLPEHRLHCRIVHHMVFERQYKNPDAVINIDCPNFFCRKCEKQYPGKYNYRSHLKSVHEIIYKQAKKRANSDIEINIDSPDFYCDKCDKRFQEKYYFRRHLKYVHNLRYKREKLIRKEGKRRVQFADVAGNALDPCLLHGY
ncbi:hypothetical protein BD408DRAFT_198021 [Parasitella parasitica]|nr:hypothetical protein BD408DRAFT_198021 [Parasitella parasitica]